MANKTIKDSTKPALRTEFEHLPRIIHLFPIRWFLIFLPFFSFSFFCFVVLNFCCVFIIRDTKKKESNTRKSIHANIDKTTCIKQSNRFEQVGKYLSSRNRNGFNLRSQSQELFLCFSFFLSLCTALLGEK